MEESSEKCTILVGKSAGKKPLARLRRRGEDNIKMDVNGIEYETMDWIHVAQDRDQ
jgi:hypothetical protein